MKTNQYGRPFFEQQADVLLEAALPYKTADGSLYCFPSKHRGFHTKASDGLEGFARTFLLAAFRISHASPARRDELVSRYAEGLVAGTSPNNMNHWLSVDHPSGQPQVEAAAIAIGLWISEDFLWQKLSSVERQQVLSYLSGMLHTRCHWNNWYLFHVVVAAFLHRHGVAEAKRHFNESLAAMEPMYRGDGWYSDSQSVSGASYDYYSGWVDSVYPIIALKMLGDEASSEQIELFRSQCAQYCSSLIHMVGADGGPLFHGRSLIYRCATAAPLAALEMGGGDTQIAPGLSRHLTGSIVNYYVRNGSISSRSVPSLGWRGEDYFPMAQVYSGPASPYWLSKAFLCLSLPDTAHFWTDEEELFPAETGAFQYPLEVPGMLLNASGRDGIVTCCNLGNYETGGPGDPLYSRLAYSTVTAPWMPTDEDGSMGVDDNGTQQIPDNWAGYVKSDGGCSDLGENRVVGWSSFASGDGVYSSYVDCNAVEPRSGVTASNAKQMLYQFVRGQASAKRVAAFFLRRVEQRSLPPLLRTSRYKEDVEIRSVTFIRRSADRLGQSGYCIADDDAIEQLSGEGWIGCRNRSGLVSVLIDFTGLGNLSVSLRGHNAFGRYSAIPTVIWNDKAQERLSSSNTDAGKVRLSVGVLIGRYNADEISSLVAETSKYVSGRLDKGNLHLE